MGGAVVLLLARKKPDFWDGAVLVAPMCKVSNLFFQLKSLNQKRKYILKVGLIHIFQ